MRETMRAAAMAGLLLLSGLTPAAQAQVEELELQVDGLSCPFCYYNLEKPLKGVPALESFQANWKEGLVRAKVKADKPVDFDAVRAGIEKTGFTLREIRLTAAGTLEREADRFLLKVPESGQRFLLFQTEAGKTPENPPHLIQDPRLEKKLAGWASAGTRLRVAGPVHAHEGGPPALQIESIEKAR